MVLTGAAIGAAIAAGEIAFTPFGEDMLNPNSIDIRLGDAIREVKRPEDGGAGVCAPIPAEGLLLRPGALYLADSFERFGSALYAPIVHGKSNIARAGLFVHVNGDMIDVGVIGPYEFQLAPVLPIRVFARMAIAQVTFWGVREG